MLGVGHERRWEPAFEELQRLIDRGALGRILLFETNVSHDQFRKLAADNWRLNPSSAPAGMMTAVGIHLTDLMTHFVGPAAEVRARSTSMIFTPPAADFVTASIVFKSGARATFTSLSITPFYGRFTCYGDAGWVEIVSEANVDRGKPTILTHADGNERRRVVYEATDTVTQNFEAWADAVEGKAPYRFTDRRADRQHPLVRGDRPLLAERRRATAPLTKEMAMARTAARTTAEKTPRLVPNDDIGEEVRLNLFRTQLTIRQAEQRAYDLFLQNLVKGTSHLSLGQEAIAAGFAVAMRPGDLSFCTYRGHAHTLARGVPVEKVLGELMQRDNGLMRGKGGSMHLTSAEHGVMGSYAIVGAHLPVACGAAWRAQYKGHNDVTVCFFGDGTTNIGAFHEALNLAAVWKLPVVFVCENNHYMEYTPIRSVTAVEHPAADRASAYGLERIVVDGNDADEVYRTAIAAYARARAGEGPSLIECMTYRHSGHSRADPGKYRPPGELEEWMKRDPIPLYRGRLRQFGVADAVVEAIESAVMREVDAATETCKAAPMPPADILHTDVYADGGWAWRN